MLLKISSYTGLNSFNREHIKLARIKLQLFLDDLVPTSLQCLTEPGQTGQLTVGSHLSPESR